MLRSGIILSLVALILAGCSRQTGPVTITDYGTYDAVIVEKGDWKLGLPVSLDSVSDLTHRETTTMIPAKHGVYWGLRASVTNRTEKQVEMYTLITHPPITSPDGKTSTQDKSEVSTLDPGQRVDCECMWFFIDSCPFEFVPGAWTCQVVVDGKVETSKEFEVSKP